MPTEAGSSAEQASGARAPQYNRTTSGGAHFPIGRTASKLVNVNTNGPDHHMWLGLTLDIANADFGRVVVCLLASAGDAGDTIFMGHMWLLIAGWWRIFRL
jgi:hypothetical protein